MIVLMTDYGMGGPYTGQLAAVLKRHAPEVDVISLFSDAPAHNPKASAYLLAAYASGFPKGTVFLCVIDPGVGGQRPAGILRADQRWFVGPDNGLFELVARRAENPVWRPLSPPQTGLSATFHGRDWFAPVAAQLARNGKPPSGVKTSVWNGRPEWPDDLAEIIYIDDFGNAMTGIRATWLRRDAVIVAGERRLAWAATFCAVSAGKAFWYENANGLVEIAANQARASDILHLDVGTGVEIKDM
ncbi:MAG: SAM-dependent chlorinase/fluorinase [Hyphomicrobiales bacterium]|nr:SAM-dependent chlorinase/fluorinase [Hyphomicrobiales bacterium]